MSGFSRVRVSGDVLHYHVPFPRKTAAIVSVTLDTLEYLIFVATYELNGGRGRAWLVQTVFELCSRYNSDVLHLSVGEYVEKLGDVRINSNPDGTFPVLA